MNENNESISAADNEELRAIYGSGAQEQVPAHLDAAVMRTASIEAQKDTAFRWFIPWRRPVTFVVTAGLSLAVVIEMSELSVFEPSSLSASDIQQEFAKKVAESSAQMREIGETATHRALGETPGVSQLSIAAKGGTLCSDDQIKSPESWFACILQLRTDGFQEDAHAEMGRLLLAYADFTPPE